MTWFVPGAPQKQKSAIELNTAVWQRAFGPSVVSLQRLSA
jgi:hypothetical protein